VNDIWLIYCRKSKLRSRERGNSSQAERGVIREIGDGVARIEGLADAMLNEMMTWPGHTGLALNLDETEVAVIILGDYTQLREGTRSAPQASCSRCLSARGCWTGGGHAGAPLDGKGPVASDIAYPVEKLAPGIIRRSPVRQPVQTGIMPSTR